MLPGLDRLEREVERTREHAAPGIAGRRGIVVPEEGPADLVDALTRLSVVLNREEHRIHQVRVVGAFRRPTEDDDVVDYLFMHEMSMCTRYGDGPLSPLNALFVICACPLTVPSALFFALNEKCRFAPLGRSTRRIRWPIRSSPHKRRWCPRGPGRLRPTGRPRVVLSCLIPSSRTFVTHCHSAECITNSLQADADSPKRCRGWPEQTCRRNWRRRRRVRCSIRMPRALLRAAPCAGRLAPRARSDGAPVRRSRRRR